MSSTVNIICKLFTEHINATISEKLSHIWLYVRARKRARVCVSKANDKRRHKTIIRNVLVLSTTARTTKSATTTMILTNGRNISNIIVLNTRTLEHYLFIYITLLFSISKSTAFILILTRLFRIGGIIRTYKMHCA